MNLYSNQVKTKLTVFSFLLLLAVFLCLREKPYTVKSLDGNKAATWDKRKTLYIAVMAIFLFCNTYFKTLAAEQLSAVQLYPLAQGSPLVLSLLMSAFFFKEKIKPLCIVGLIILFIGLLLINIIKF